MPPHFASIQVHRPILVFRRPEPQYDPWGSYLWGSKLCSRLFDVQARIQVPSVLPIFWQCSPHPGCCNRRPSHCWFAHWLTCIVLNGSMTQPFIQLLVWLRVSFDETGSSSLARSLINRQRGYLFVGLRAGSCVLCTSTSRLARPRRRAHPSIGSRAIRRGAHLVR